MDPTYTLPCPACAGQGIEAPLVERRRRVDNKPFMGCSRWPDCDFTRSVPAWVEMKRAGALSLPGLE